MNLFITGARGFVGTNLVSYLKSQTEIYCSLRSELQKPFISLHDCEAVVHLAGKAHDLRHVLNPEEYYEVNTKLTQRIYDSFLTSNASKFIYISSVKAVADRVDDELTELANPAPLTHYGKSKLEAERYIQAQPLPVGKSYYILRPCMIHGPGNKGNLNLLYNFVSRGLTYPLASFNNKRSFLSVENLCFVIKEILERDDIPSGVYNVADDEALSTTEVVQLLSESMEKRAKLLHLPVSIVKGIAKLGDIIPLPLNSDRLQKLTENYAVDNTKIKQVLKKPLPLSAREGILKTARSFKYA